MHAKDLQQSVKNFIEHGYGYLYSGSDFVQLYRRIQHTVMQLNTLEEDTKQALTDNRQQQPGQQQGYLQRSNIVHGFRFTKGKEPLVINTQHAYKWRNFLNMHREIINDINQFAVSPFLKELGKEIKNNNLQKTIEEGSKNTLELYTYNKEKGGCCVQSRHIDANILTVVVSPYAEGFWIGSEENEYLPNPEKILLFAGKKMTELIPTIKPVEHGTRLKGDERKFNHTSVKFYI